MHAVDGDDADVFGYHYENQMLAVNLFHMRGGKIMDKREFFWEDMHEIVGEKGFNPGEFFSALLKQVYLDQQYIPHNVYVPVDFEDRAMLEEVLSEGRESQGADPRAAARREALAGRPGRTECQAGLRPALSGDEAGDQGHPGSVAGCAHACPSCRAASSASTSRTSKARRRWRRWWCGKTAR